MCVCVTVCVCVQGGREHLTKNTLVPKVYNHVILFNGLKTLGTFIEFCLVGSKLVNPNFQPIILLIIIGDVYKFNVHFLMPENPWSSCAK